MRRDLRKRRAGCNCATIGDTKARVRDLVRNLAHDRLRDLTAFYRRCSRMLERCADAPTSEPSLRSYSRLHAGAARITSTTILATVAAAAVAVASSSIS